MTKVKICGIRHTAQALAAAKAGADAVGLVFYKQSPRFVELDIAQQIALALPPFTSRVGLFVNASPADVRQTLDVVCLDVLQFHGDEDEAFCRQFNKPYVKAIRVKEGVGVKEQIASFSSASALLLDAWHPDKYGGTGESFDWSQFPQATDKPLILAGGLNVANVGEAILKCQPYAVDTSGGVESSPGEKDSQRIAAFMNAVRHADNSMSLPLTEQENE